MTDEQRAKRSKYRKKDEVKTKYAKYQKENFKTIAASFKRSEAEYIAKIFTNNGIKPAEVLRGAALALLNGEPIRTTSEPLEIPTDSGNPTE